MVYLHMFNQKKRDIFFDLDHTLWDFDKNAEETLHELYFKYKFDSLFDKESSTRFIETYTVLYHRGKISKPELRKARFADTFTALGVSPELFPEEFELEYLTICPQKTNLFPDAHETLAYLGEKYNLHLISNGFKEACETNLEKSNLKKYFKHVFISEVIGVNKPDPKIFRFALETAAARAEASLMVGDNLDADIRGAMNAGIDAIFFNPNGYEKP